MNPTKVPIQICLRITRRSFLTRAACSPSSGPAASSRRSCGARRPVVISCSTKERRTETIRAASIVSPVSGSQHHKSLDIALAFWGHVNVKSLHDARTYFALDSRKTMKKIGTSKTLFVMVGKRSSGQWGYLRRVSRREGWVRSSEVDMASAVLSLWWAVAF